MRPLFIMQSLVSLVGAAVAQDIESIAGQVKRNCERIEIFSADAYVYEYYG